MKAKIYIEDEFDEDNSLTTDLYFDKDSVKSWYINEEGSINASIDGTLYTFEYNEYLYNFLINKFL